MKVQCQACGSRFKIQDSMVPEQGLLMSCPKCSAQMMVTREGAGGQEAAPPPPPRVDPFADLPDAQQELAPPDFGDLNLDDLAEPPPPPRDEVADTRFDFDPPAPKRDGLSGELGLDDDFSLDDALADLDDDMELDSQESLPPVPGRKGAAPAPHSALDDLILDEPLGDAGAPSFDDLLLGSDTPGSAPGGGVEDEFSLDMPSLLDEAATDFQTGGRTLFDELPELKTPRKAEADQEFPEESFSFDDMLGEAGAAQGGDDLLPGLEEEDGLPGLDETLAPPLGGDLLGALPDLNPDEAGPTLYQIQRKNGKTFGPFPETTVLQMIADGKLAGNELVRVGNADWLPITQVEPFARQIKSGGKGEKELDALMPAGGKGKKKELGKERERIQEELKKRRRAGSLDVVSPMKKGGLRFRPIFILPLLLIVAALGLAAYMTVVAGYELGEIPGVLLGDDGVEKPLVEQLKARDRKLFDTAQEEIARDNYQGYSQAREILLDMLKVQKFRGEEAVWALLAQVDYQILRRYGVNQEIRKEAEKAMATLSAVRREDVEIRFARAAQMMFEKKFAEARDVLVNDILMQGHPNNAKALHLAAEAHLYLPDPSVAEKYLDRLISSDAATAQTYHLQGSLYTRMANSAKAKAAYAKALELDPEHLDSQIELAGILVSEEGGLTRAERELLTIRNTFKDRMSRKQLARVHYYAGLIHIARNEHYKVVKELASAIDNEPDNYLYNLTLAGFHFDKHEFEKAKEQYGQCLVNNPQAIACHLGQGRTDLSLGHPDQALFKLEEATKVDPDNAELYYLLGRAYERLFRPDKALEMFEKAITLDPGGVAYFTSAAMCYLQQDNAVKAGEYIQKARLIQANSPLVHNFLGRMHLHQGDVEKAIEEFKLAIASDANFIDAHLHLADTYLGQGNHEDAISGYEAVLKLDDRVDGAYFGLANTYYRMGDLDRAITEFEKALNLNNRSHEYYYRTGVAYYDKGELDKALGVLEKSSELSPGQAGPPFYMGRIYMDRETYDRAGEFFERALQIEPKNVLYVYYMGWLLEKQEKYADALDYYDRAIETDPKFAPAYVRKGITLRAQNKFLSAIQMFRWAQRLDSSISMAHSELGDCYFEMRKYPEAIKQYESVIRLNTRDADPYRKMGLVYQEMGQASKAVTYFQKAVELEPEDPQAYLGLGYAHKRLRRNGEAIRSFERYLELNPTAIDRADVEDEIFYLKRR